jgi:hypothetical protein
VYDINGLKDKVLLKDLCNYSFSDEDLRWSLGLLV